MKCIICKFNYKYETVYFETKNFIFFEAKPPIVVGHALLAPKMHIRTEIEIPKNYIEEYNLVKIRAYKLITKKYKYAPLIFINPPQQQSVKHFHINYVPGIFGISGVKNALTAVLNNK